MKKMISLALMAMALLPTSVLAQEEQEAPEVEWVIETIKDSEFKAYVQADFVSHYMWRGIDMGGISIQPEAGISWKGLSLSAFGNAGFDKEDPQEIDLTLGYEKSLGKWGFNVGITDYWSSGVDEEDRYFYYDNKKTPHQLEANLGFSCQYFSLQAYTMFWGNDYKIDGDRAYSTYVELSVPFRAGGLDWDVRAGITPMESAGYVTTHTEQGLTHEVTLEDNHYFYGEGFTCNVASIRATKNLEYKNLRLPVFAEIHTNPYLKKANFLVGISVIAF
jgi:opacity protein-like surface antigen